MVLPDWAMLAAPATTLPPVGNALAVGSKAMTFWAIHAKVKAAKSLAALTLEEDEYIADTVGAYMNCIQFNDISAKKESCDRMSGLIFNGTLLLLPKLELICIDC